MLRNHKQRILMEFLRLKLSRKVIVLMGINNAASGASVTRLTKAPLRGWQPD